MTGLLCPGCGSLRGTHAALHGHFGEMLRLNPALVLGAPALAWMVAGELTALARGRALPPPPLGARGAWAILVVLVAWWILRNVFQGLSTA